MYEAFLGAFFNETQDFVQASKLLGVLHEFNYFEMIQFILKSFKSLHFPSKPKRVFSAILIGVTSSG
jgi:hypothetical protein